MTTPTLPESMKILALGTLYAASICQAVSAFLFLKNGVYLSAARWYIQSQYTFIFACALMVYVLVDFSIQKNREKSGHQDGV